MPLDDATSAYLARVRPPTGPRVSTTAERPRTTTPTSSVRRDGTYRKATLDILYSLARTGQLPETALQALTGG